MPPVLMMCCVAVGVFQTCHASCSDDVLCGCWCVMPPVLMMCCVAVDVFQTCHASCSDDVLCGC